MATIELGTYLRGKREEYHACIEAAVACAVAGEMCADACLDAQDVKTMVRCIRLCHDTTDACNAAISAMARGSEMAPEFCRMCAHICDACADECEKHGMEECRLCAEACRRCADECRKVAA